MDSQKQPANSHKLKNLSNQNLNPFKPRASQQELKLPVSQVELKKKTAKIFNKRQPITERDGEQSSLESTSKLKDDELNLISLKKKHQQKNFIDSRGPNSLLMSKMTVTNNASINYEEIRSPQQAQPVEQNKIGAQSSNREESLLKDSDVYKESVLHGSKLTPGREIAVNTLVNEQMTTAVKHEHSSVLTLEDSSQMLFSNRKNLEQNTITTNDKKAVEVFQSVRNPQSNAKIVTDRNKISKINDQELSIFSDSKELKNTLRVVNIGSNSRNQPLVDYQTTGNIKNIVSKKQRAHLSSSIQESNQKIKDKQISYNTLKSTTPGYSNLPKIEAYSNIQISNQDSLMLPFDKAKHADLQFKNFEQKRSSSYMNLYESSKKFNKKQNTVRNQQQPWILNSSQGHSTDSVSKYFGKHLNIRGDNIPGLNGIRDLTLREALTKSNETLREPSPPKKKLKQNILYKPNQTMLNMKTDDLMKVIKGRDIKKQFISENKEQIRQYMNYVMAQEDKMIGYVEYTNQNMSEHYQIQKAMREKEMKKRKEELDLIEETRLMNEKQMRQTADQVKLLPKILQDSRIGKDKNPIEQANNITTNVMENWLNQTLSDAEHLDIPGCILRPEHKSPIFRYGIDRIELNNWGIPDEYIDRIYRCLFVYSVGFYEMVNKVIEHSGQKYQIITRLWKVFAVLLEYCCQNDYQMIITKISTEHEEVIEKLKEGFDLQCQDFYDNEKILKNNIAVLQQSNQELERDRTNERSLRLRLEEEYMQNSKNHEEEVQLRLKFESKLNAMHGQIRESDIMFTRCKEELENSLKKIELQAQVIEQQTKELIQVKKDNHESEETIKKLTNENTFIEDENRKKKEQLTMNEKLMKINVDETNHTRYQLGQVQNGNNNLQLQVENLQEIIAQYEKKQNVVENLHQEAEKQIKILEERNKELKQQCDNHQVELNQTKHIVQNIEVTNEQKITQNDMLQGQVDRYKNESELLDLKTRTQEGEIKSLEDNIKRLAKDLEDASERLHQTNRYRHELEIRVKSQSITTQKQFQQIVEKEQNLDLLKKQISTYQLEIKDKDKRLTALTKKLEETQAEFDKKVETHGKEITTLKKLLDTEKMTKYDWAQKFKQHDAALTAKQEQVFSQQQQIDVMKIDLDKNSIIITQQSELISTLQDVKQNLSDELQKTIKERDSRQAELVDMLDVARKLEIQRHKQIGEFEAQYEELKVTNVRMQEEFQMTVEDFMSRAIREEHMLEIQREQFSKQEQYLANKHEQKTIQLQNQHGFMVEDLTKRISNKQNRIDVLQFELMEAKSNLKSQKNQLSLIYKNQMKNKQDLEKEQTQNNVEKKTRLTPEPEEMTMESVDIGIQVEDEILNVNGQKVMVGVKSQQEQGTQTDCTETLEKQTQVNLDPMNSSFYVDQNPQLSKYMTQKISKLASKYQNSTKSQKEPRFQTSPQQIALQKKEIIDHIQTFKDPKINIQQNSSLMFDKVELSLKSQVKSYQESHSQYMQSSNIVSNTSQLQQKKLKSSLRSSQSQERSGEQSSLRRTHTKMNATPSKIQSSSDSKFKALKPWNMVKAQSKNRNKDAIAKQTSEVLESIQTHISNEIEKRKIVDSLTNSVTKVISIPTQQPQPKLNLVKQGSTTTTKKPQDIKLVSEYQNNDRQISTFRDNQRQGITEESDSQYNRQKTDTSVPSIPQSYYRPNPQFEMSKIGGDLEDKDKNENLSIIQDMADYSMAIQNQRETQMEGPVQKKKLEISQAKKNTQIKGLLKGANARALQQLT